MTDHKALLRHQQEEVEEVDHALSHLKDGIGEKSGDKIAPQPLHTRYLLDGAKEIERSHL